MTTLRSFLQPLLIRWRECHCCAWCLSPATIRCKEHGVRLCGGPNCTHVHGHFHRKADRQQGSLLASPRCVFVGLNTWLDYAVNAAAVFCAGVLLLWLVVVL